MIATAVQSGCCVSCVIAFSNFPQPVLPSQYNFLEDANSLKLSQRPRSSPSPHHPAKTHGPDAQRGLVEARPPPHEAGNSNMLRKDNRNTSYRGPSNRRGRLKSVLAAARHRTRHKGEMMYPLLFVSFLVVLISVPASSSASLIDCTHATSRCTDCSPLCAVAQFYPLLAPPCHPNSTVRFEYCVVLPIQVVIIASTTHTCVKWLLA